MAEYFSGLNYSLSNEDSFVERGILNSMTHDKINVLAVCGAGSRVLPLLTKNVRHITVLDLAAEQLQLFRLRLATLKQFSHQDYLEFWGYQTASRPRLDYLLSLSLDSQDIKFWTQHHEKWQGGFLFLGRWENYLLRLGQLFRRLFFVNVEPLFMINSQQDRERWYHDHFPQKRLDFFLQVFANPLFFNLFLYKGRFAKSEESFANFLNRVFRKILIEKDPKKSFFAQMLFLGDLRFSEGWPAEASDAVFQSAQKFEGHIEVVQADLLTHLSQNLNYDFLSLSDVASYLTDEQIKSLELYLRKNPTSEWRAVIRSFRRHPQFNEGLLSHKNRQLEQQAEDSDSIGVYKFHIFTNT